jgi:type I restriction enzyme S subunit
VAKLEKLLGKVETSEQRLTKIPVLLKRFRQSVLAAACSGQLTADWRQDNIADSYSSITVKSIAEYVGGFAYKSTSFLDAGKHQVIRIGNVRPMAIKLEASPVFIPDQLAKKTQRFNLMHGDIVLSMTGTKYKHDYGFAAMVPDVDRSLFLNQRVARIRCGKSVLPKFLLYWFQTDRFRDFFFSGETGNVNQGNVGADGIRNALIELPPLVEQEEIIRRVEELFALADQIEARYAKAKAYIDKLTQSILAKAFRGELVPQDPNDEPASALLERIRQQRNGENQTNNARKTTKRTNAPKRRRTPPRRANA